MAYKYAQNDEVNDSRGHRRPLPFVYNGQVSNAPDYVQSFSEMHNVSIPQGKKLIALRFRASESNKADSVLWDGAYRKSCDFCIEKKLKCAGRGTTCKKCISKGICCTYSLKHRSVVRARDMGMLTTNIILNAEEALNSGVKTLSPSGGTPRKCTLPPIRDLLAKTNTLSSPQALLNEYQAECFTNKGVQWQPQLQNGVARGSSPCRTGNQCSRFLGISESSGGTDDSGSSICDSESGNGELSKHHRESIHPQKRFRSCSKDIVQVENRNVGRSTDKMSQAESPDSVSTLNRMLERLAKLQRSGHVEEVLLQLKALRSAGFITEQFCNGQCEKVMITSHAKIMCSIKQTEPEQNSAGFQA